MGKIAFVFSGQGAQYPGMGKSLYENCKSAAALYDFAESIRHGTMEQSFNGTAEQLTRTENAQPCMYLVSVSAALALHEYGLFEDGAAGFSLGEISALGACGAYSEVDGFRLVTERGRIMQKAADKCDTAMAAVLKVSAEDVENICKDITDVYPVNYNSPIQTVIAGSKAAIAQFKEKAADIGARSVDLAVSAAFHSPYMNEASDEFAEALKDFEITAPFKPVYANLTALPYKDSFKEMLAKQMKNPVLWNKTIDNMIADGYDTFIEVGPGKTLTGLIKKISSDVKTYNVETIEDVEKTVKAVKENA